MVDSSRTGPDRVIGRIRRRPIGPPAHAIGPGGGPRVPWYHPNYAIRTEKVRHRRAATAPRRRRGALKSDLFAELSCQGDRVPFGQRRFPHGSAFFTGSSPRVRLIVSRYAFSISADSFFFCSRALLP